MTRARLRRLARIYHSQQDAVRATGLHRATFLLACKRHGVKFRHTHTQVEEGSLEVHHHVFPLPSCKPRYG